jgi:hypothetical protein
MFVVSINDDICGGCGLCAEDARLVYLVSKTRKHTYQETRPNVWAVKPVQPFVKAELFLSWKYKCHEPQERRIGHAGRKENAPAG